VASLLVAVTLEVLSELVRSAAAVLSAASLVASVAKDEFWACSVFCWASMVAIGTHEEPLARGLVLVDVAPKIEQDGAMRIGAFMSEHLEDGFASLDEVADAVAAYNPHRPRPTDLSGLKKNVRQRDDGRWVWHWDPRFMKGKLGSQDETRASLVHEGRLQDAARTIKVPTLLVRGRVSDLLSEEGAQDLLRLVPHAEYVDVEGAGHMVAGDKNDLFNDAIVNFLDRLK